MPAASVRHGNAAGRRLGPRLRRTCGQHPRKRSTCQHERKRRNAPRDQHERGERQQPVHRMHERAPPDAQQRLEDQRNHGGLEAKERSRDERQVPVLRIDERERQQDQHRGQQEAQSRDDAAPRSVQSPAEPDCELQRLGARDQHADVERLHESALVDPAPGLDHLAMHDRDLPGRTAERNEPELEPEAERLAARGHHGATGRSASSGRESAGSRSAARSRARRRAVRHDAHAARLQSSARSWMRSARSSLAADQLELFLLQGERGGLVVPDGLEQATMRAAVVRVHGSLLQGSVIGAYQGRDLKAATHAEIAGKSARR